MADITMYGANWCPLTTQAKRYLDEAGIPYVYIDIEQDTEAAAFVRSKNDGKERKPTILIDDEVLVEPDADALNEALRRHDMVAGYTRWSSNDK
jgi:glutaredoxin